LISLSYQVSRLVFLLHESTTHRLTAALGLETLELGIGLYDIDHSEANFEFPNLRRLSFDSTAAIQGNREEAHQIFSRIRMPRLVDLSFGYYPDLGVSHDLFYGILPQIQTLALQDAYSCLSTSAVSDTLCRTRNLEHLSLAIRHYDQTQLLDEGKLVLRLKTLHLPITIFLPRGRPAVEVWRNRVETLALDGMKDIKIDKLVLYGSKDLVSRSMPESRVELFEWREDTMDPPFEDFDGR